MLKVGLPLRVLIYRGSTDMQADHGRAGTCLPNSSTMRGLPMAAAAAEWSLIHWVKKVML